LAGRENGSFVKGDGRERSDSDTRSDRAGEGEEVLMHSRKGKEEKSHRGGGVLFFVEGPDSIEKKRTFHAPTLGRFSPLFGGKKDKSLPFLKGK